MLKKGTQAGRSRWARRGLITPSSHGLQEHTNHQRIEKKVAGESHRSSGLTVRLMGDPDELRIWCPAWL